MCRASCKKTYKCVTCQQRIGEQSRLSTWPDVSVLIRRCALHSCLMPFICVCGEVGLHHYFTSLEEVGIKRSVGNVVNSVVECLPTCLERVS
jgi:hypothetical protein